MTFHIKTILEEIHMFTCECELCINDDILSLGDMQAINHTSELIKNYPYYKEFKKTREYLKEAWKIMNTNPIFIKGLAAQMFSTARILDAIAYHLSIPFFSQ